MTAQAARLKARIRNLAKVKGVTAQVILQNYMFERFLERLSLSVYRDKFILKGGMLIAAMVGLDARSTMDLDATLRELAMTEASISMAVQAICAVHVDDDVVFTFEAIEPIRADDVYGGYRVKLVAVYETIHTPLSIDLSTGDKITPEPVRYAFTGIFDLDKRIVLWAYNIETVLAEKIETILRRNVFNTRPRDFYDVYVLSATQPYDPVLLKASFSATAAHRNSSHLAKDAPRILSIIQGSAELKRMWDGYRRQFPYAQEIEYEQTIEALRKMVEEIR